MLFQRSSRHWVAVREVALTGRSRLIISARSTTEQSETSSQTDFQSASQPLNLDKLTRQTAQTFAPRPSTATKNPAVKGSVLYDIFEWQAWISMAAGGLLSFNLIFPTDEPSIPRLLGMVSVLFGLSKPFPTAYVPLASGQSGC